MSPDERISWQPVLEEAAAVVESYDSGVTLRQLFYRLVARQRIPNSEYAYKKLSERTAMARRRGAFPDLIDRTRTIHVDRGFAGPAEALQRLADAYRRDRTEGQATSIYLGAEKAGYVELLRSWFEPLGLPVLALGGYASQTYVDEVVADVRTQDRRAVMLYAGDFDATGLDIERDFRERTGCFEPFVRVALTAEQVDAYHLPLNPGKPTDSRAPTFTATYGQNVQVEFDALPPEVLRELYADAMRNLRDVSREAAVLEREAAEQARLTALAVEQQGRSAP